MTGSTPEWHALPGDEALRFLRSRADGLSAADAWQRLDQVGANALPSTPQPSALRLLVRQVTNPLLYALLASAAVAIALGEVADGLVVLAVVVLNALIGFVQELRAGRAISALAKLVAEPARVLRDGRWLEIPADELVPGDILAVAQGDRVGADARILHAEALRTQESALTGESEPVIKGPDAVDESTPLAERQSLLYAGTVVAAGAGRAVVVGTGRATELGQISDLLQQAEPLQTPLTTELERIGRAVTVAVGVAAVVLAAVAAVRGFPAGDAAIAGVGLAVAAVPEGLPAVVTIALAAGVRRMARRRAIVRQLPAVETLGSTTVVASDKTGTLTRNEMTVRLVWASGHTVDLSRPGAVDRGTPAVREVVRAGVLCNDATAGADGTGALGDPTEIALLDAARRGGVDPDTEREVYPRLAALPFDAELRLMATLHARGRAATVLYVKGAPEAVLPRCLPDGRDAAAREIELMTESGQRVLVFAAREDVDPEDLGAELESLELLGLAAMIDPPRDSAADAVAACQQAGVRVLMITGDHPRTARAIGAALGLPAASALTGSQLDELDHDALRLAVGKTDVYARVAPEHKLRLVRALQDGGDVVAMTGDGVNDAPALRQADIGVAMGRGGTAAAKEAADMVLADDDFSTLRAAVEEGRRVYDNLVKALSFVLPTSIGQALLIAVAVVAFPLQGGAPLLPVEPVQVLWINLIVAVALALPLALEVAEPDVMRRPPRQRSTPLLDRPLLVRTVAVSLTLTAVALGLFAIEHDRQLDAGVSEGLALARAQTTAVTGAVLLQALYLLTCRSLTHSNRELGRWANPAVYGGILVVLALQALFVLAPFMHDLFGAARPDPEALALAATASLAVLPVTWAEERWRRRRLASDPAAGVAAV